MGFRWPVARFGKLLPGGRARNSELDRCYSRTTVPFDFIDEVGDQEFGIQAEHGGA